MLPAGVRRAFRLLNGGRAIEREVSEEIRFHLHAREAELESAGLDAASAREQALREYGDINASRAELTKIDGRRHHRTRWSEWFASVKYDANYALRGLRRAPGFATVILLTLALGIGANTAVFSVVNALLLNPIPYRDAGRVVVIWQSLADQHVQLSPSQASIDTWQRNARLFDGIESFDQGDHTLTGHGDPQTLRSVSVSASFPKFAGVGLLRGRAFREDEARPGAAPVVVLSEHVWRGTFQGDEGIVGQTLRLDDKLYTVIGVATSNWRLPSLWQPQADIWLPLAIDAKRLGGMTLARLKRDVTPLRAEQELIELDSQLKTDGMVGSEKASPRIQLLRDTVWFRDTLFLLAGSVAILLLIACVNVAHLLLARGAVREREFGIRRALGASRARLVQQLLVESGLVTVGGSALGAVVGFAGLKILVALRPSGLDAISLASIDATVLAFTAIISVATGVAFGLIGSLQPARSATAESLKATSNAGTTNRERGRLRAVMVVTEMALSTMLLVGAVLLGRTVFNLRHVDPGFDTSNLYSMNFKLSGSHYSTAPQREVFANQLAERMKAVPGVASYTMASAVPPHQSGIMIGEIEVEGASRSGGRPSVLHAFHIRPEYFATIGMRLADGRPFDATSKAQHEIIINGTVARQFWPGKSAVGQHFRMKGSPGEAPAPWFTVAAVVPDAAFGGLVIDPNTSVVYFPSNTGTEWGAPSLVFRLKPGANPLQAIRRVVHELDPTLVQPPIGSVRDAMNDTIASQQFTMLLLVVFAALAALLSAVGLYGVISYMVAQRTREIGIRVALGATRQHITRLVVGNGVTMCAVGLVIGLGGSVAATKLVKSLLFGVAITDPASYLAGGVLLLLVSVLACVMPLRRASRIDPLIAMRAE